jgi:hypothetical protein
MKAIVSFLILSILYFSSLSCNTTGPGDDKEDNTADTTSHNFTWQTWKFGEHSGSILYDVAVIDENNIYAVGEIYMNDSTGEADPHAYGVLHWDGDQWIAHRLTAQNPSGGTSFITPRGIFVVDSTEIWFSNGSVFRFDGKKITNAYWLINYSGYTGGIFNNGEGAEKIFGTARNNIFVIGNNGAIAQYNGSKWQKIESLTELDIYDILGKENDNGEYEILCAAAKHTVNTEKKIMRIENNTVKDISTAGIRSSISSLWFKPGKKYYAAGAGIYSKEDINSDQSWKKLDSITNYYLYSIDGQQLNDIAVCGSYGELLHFNGASWKSFRGEPNVNADEYYEIKIKNDMIIAVGYDSPKAVITIGKR